MNLAKNRIHLLNETSFLTFSFMDRSIYTIIYLRLLGESSSKGKFRRNVRLQLYSKSVYRFTDCQQFFGIFTFISRINTKHEPQLLSKNIF